MSESAEYINAYIYNSVAFDTENGAVMDLFYITEDGSRNIVRLYNFDIWFLVCRFPGMTDEQFRAWMRKTLPGTVQLKFRSDLKENSTFMFDNPMLYAEISAQSPKTLKQVHKSLVSAARSYYRTLRINDLSPWDRVLYDNMEDPFRYTNYVLDIDNIKYYLSTTYKIPCIGGVRLKKSALVNTYMHGTETPKLHVKFSTITSLNCNHNENIKELIEYDQNINYMHHMKLMTYDLETYTQRTDIKEKDKVIMNIGMSLFNILSQVPTYKACLCIKPFTEEDIASLSGRLVRYDREQDNLEEFCISHGLSSETVDEIKKNIPSTLKSMKYTRYVVFNEMINKSISENENLSNSALDYTDYIVFNSERDMLMHFMRIITLKKPDYFGGFNNYGYDDPYIWSRLGLYGQQMLFLSTLYSAYDLSIKTEDEVVTNHPLLTRSTTPRYEKFQIKIDSMAYPNNETFKGNSMISIDVYKIMLASDAKLYTQMGKGNLKSMLQTNKVKNPYNGAELDKYDLSYVDMFRNWDNDEKIYEINHYCMYDAVTCGVLLIKTAQIIDKIEMSALTNTSVADSYYRAVTTRILAITNEYAHNYGFAMMDKPVDQRPGKSKDDE